MRYQHLTTIHPLIDQYLKIFLSPGDSVIDATLGNGHDAQKIAKIIGATGTLYGFDIQEAAIQKSEEKLAQIPKIEQPNITLIYDSHANFSKHIEEEVALIIYNLGYLPGGDKSITTLPESTLASIRAGLTLLQPYGKMLIAVYHGHETGKAERDALAEFLESLDQRHYHVMKQQFINQKNNPPFLYIIEKSRDAADTPSTP